MSLPRCCDLKKILYRKSSLLILADWECENQYRETLDYDELIFKKIYTQAETFMVYTHDKNRYKNHTFVVASKIENPSKDRTIDVAGFTGFSSSDRQSQSIRPFKEHPKGWI